MNKKMRKTVSMILPLMLAITLVPTQQIFAEDSMADIAETETELQNEDAFAVESAEVNSDEEIFAESLASGSEEEDKDIFTVTEMESWESDTEEFMTDAENGQEIEPLFQEGSTVLEETGEIEFTDGLRSNAASEIKDYNNLGYAILEDNTAELVGIIEAVDFDNVTDLIIPDSVDGHIVSRIGDHAFEDEGIQGNLVLPKNLVSIGDGAFKENYFSGSLILPETLESIGNEAFRECRGFTGDLLLPEKIAYIGSRAFSECTGFNGCLKIPDNLKTIGDEAFSQCRGFTGDLQLPGYMTSIGKGVFSGCSGFNGKLILPEGMAAIGEEAFSECGSFSGSLTLPEGLKYIGDRAFYKCEFEGDLIVPESVESIGDRGIRISLNNGSIYDVGKLIIKKIPQNLSSTAVVDMNAELRIVGMFAMRVGEQYKNYVETGMALSFPIISDWSSSNEKVAVVDKNGVVTAVGQGVTQITATAYNGATGSTTLYVQKKAAGNKKGNIVWNVPEKIKLGYEFSQPTIEYGMGLSIAEMGNLPEDSIGKYLLCDYKQSSPGIISYPESAFLAQSDKISMNEHAYARYIGYYAVNPGTITFQLKLGRLGPDSERENVGEPYTVTIEEPVIKTNEPKQAVVGDKFTLRSELKNTDLPNEEVAYYKNKLQNINGEYYCLGDNLVYEPEFIVESGSNLIKRSGGDFSQTLTASEQFEFTGAGTVKIKVRYEHLKLCSFTGNEYSPEKTITIQVKDNPVKVSSVKMNKSSLKLKKGQSYTLKASLEPSNAADKAVTWTSSNTKVAVVKNGKVTVKGIGTAVITAKAADGSGKYGTCKVTVGYTIKYQLNKGKNNSGNPSVYYKQNIALKNPVRAGYLFKGWYRDKKYKKKITKLTAKSSGNLTLYAKWEKVSIGPSSISSLSNAKGNKAVVKFKKVSKASGYQVVYGKDSKFRKPSTLIAKKNSATINKLQKKKTYYVKVRAYRVDSAGKKVYGKYSAVKKVTIKK